MESKYPTIIDIQRKAASVEILAVDNCTAKGDQDIEAAGEA